MFAHGARHQKDREAPVSGGLGIHFGQSSHHKFRKQSQTVIVPHPNKDLPVGTARNIAKLAGWL